MIVLLRYADEHQNLIGADWKGAEVVAPLMGPQIDLLRNLERGVVHMIQPSVPHDDVGEVLGPNIGQEQRIVLQLIEVVEAIALLEAVELLIEDESEGRAHLALADRRLRYTADEQVDVPDVDIFRAIDRLEQCQELGLLRWRPAQVRAEIRPGRVWSEIRSRSGHIGCLVRLLEEGPVLAHIGSELVQRGEGDVIRLANAAIARVRELTRDEHSLRTAA